MATPTCTSASLNIACLRGYKLNRLQKLQLLCYYMAKENAANGGTNYSSNMPTTLLAAARAQFEKWDRDAMLTALVSIAYKNQLAAGGAEASDPNTEFKDMPRMQGVNEDDLIKMIVFLTCAKGTGRNPPAG